MRYLSKEFTIYTLFPFLVGMKNPKNLILRPPETYIFMLAYYNEQYYKNRYSKKKNLLFRRLSKITARQLTMLIS